MQTYLPKKIELAKDAKWYIVDAEGQALGKVATVTARVLAGKHRPDFTPHLDLGDSVIIINVAKVRLTGQKSTGKLYHTHSGYKGNLKTKTAGAFLEKNPRKVLELAVAGMLPKNKLKDARLKRLKIYAEAEHGQEAQKPTPLTV